MVPRGTVIHHKVTVPQIRPKRESPPAQKIPPAAGYVTVQIARSSMNPQIFLSTSAVHTYVQPVLKNCGLEYLHVRASQENGEETRELLTRILRLREREPEGYELEVIALMHLLWSRLWQRGILQPGEEGQKTDDDLNTQKDMAAFLYQHYGEESPWRKLRPREMSAAANAAASSATISSSLPLTF